MNRLKNNFFKVAGLWLIALAIFAFILLPLPYYVEAPGKTVDLKTIVKVDGQEDIEKGSFSLTSVSVGRASGVRLLMAQFSDFQDVISQEQMFGGATSAEYEQMQKYYMESSKNSAIQQAFELAQVDYTMTYKGIYIMSIDKNSNFKNDLALGDTIIKADGNSFENKEDFMDYVKNKKIGDDLTITHLHDGKEKTATQKLMDLEGNPGIGITLVDDNEIASDVKVDFDTGSIGGPSAGLMFTLEIYDQLTKGDLRQGKKVAGTGTINSEGEIGRIGGIDKKVASASQNDIEIFFAPDDELSEEILEKNPKLKSNYEEAVAAAKKLNTKMKIVPVKHVQDAIDYLNQLNK